MPAGAGLLAWREHLVYYALEGTSQRFKLLVGDGFIDLPSLTATATPKPIAANLGGQIVTNADNTTEGIHHLGAGSRYDGHVVSSWLHMDHPGREKLLHRITLMLDDSLASFQAIVKYRVNDATSWTSAKTTAASRRIVTADLNTSFYNLQIRAEIDDNTGNNKDYRIAALSALYTVDA